MNKTTPWTGSSTESASDMIKHVKLNTPTLIGVVVAIIVSLLLLAIFLRWKRRQRLRKVQEIETVTTRSI
jgi:Mg2+/citrate symporter